MEGRGLSIVVVCMMMMGLVAGESTAWFKDFDKCMSSCLIDCTIPPWLMACPARCLAKCIIRSASTQTIQNAHRFCTSGCATTLCSKLISKHNYRLDEVGSCVGGCSQSCANNYVPTAN